MIGAPVADLASHRIGELAAALAALGVREHRFLDEIEANGTRYTDSGMTWVSEGVAGPDPDATEGFAFADVDEAAARLAALIREAKPEAVVTYDDFGGYGHPDHIQAVRVTKRALEMVGDELNVRLWQRLMPGENASGVVASEGEAINIDVAPVLDRVLDAMRAHRTQIKDIERAEEPTDEALAWFALSNSVRQAVPPMETYVDPGRLGG